MTVPEQNILWNATPSLCKIVCAEAGTTYRD